MKRGDVESEGGCGFYWCWVESSLLPHQWDRASQFPLDLPILFEHHDSGIYARIIVLGFSVTNVLGPTSYVKSITSIYWCLRFSQPGLWLSHLAWRWAWMWNSSVQVAVKMRAPCGPSELRWMQSITGSTYGPRWRIHGFKCICLALKASDNAILQWFRAH